MNTNTPPWDSFGQRIRWARSKQGMSQAELAIAAQTPRSGMSVNRKTIAFWERIGTESEHSGNKARYPNPYELLAIVQALDISGRWLMYYEREPFLYPEFTRTTKNIKLSFKDEARELIEFELFSTVKKLSDEQVKSLTKTLKAFT